MKEVTRYLFGCCSWEGSWTPEHPGQSHPEIAEWGRDNYSDSFVASEDYDQLRRSVEIVIKTFEDSESAGYQSRDRRYAIDVLRKALEP